MKVHYFYKRKWNGNWFSIELEAIMEEDSFSSLRQAKEKSFIYLEQINCHISKDMDQYHDSTFKIEFGKNSSFGHWAKSVHELYKDQLDKTSSLKSFSVITRAQYERLRKLAFVVYEKHKFMDFDMVKEKQTYSIIKIIE